MTYKCCFVVLLSMSALALPLGAQAEPAPWFKWQSINTGKYICRQTDPGSGWRRHSGPYLDAGCRKKGPPPQGVRL